MLTKVPILIHLRDMKQVLPVVILLLILFFFFFLKTFRFSLHWIYFFHLFSPYLPASGKTICTGSDDASLRIWNPKSGENIHVVKGIHLYPTLFHVLKKAYLSGHYINIVDINKGHIQNLPYLKNNYIKIKGACFGGACCLALLTTLLFRSSISH